MNKENTLSKNKAETLLNDLVSFCTEKNLAKKELLALQNKLVLNEINLTVLGEFNRGKSTFVNSLIGEEVLPVGVTPTTASINILKYSEEKTLKVLYKDETEEVKNFDTKLFETLDYDKVREIEISYPSDFLKNTIIIDTPGVNDINTQKVEVTYNFIPKSDAVIFLLDAEQILSKSEFEFFQSNILSNDIDKIIFIVNKADNLQPEELEEVLAYSHKKISAYINEPVIVTYSARNALEAKKANNEKQLELSNYYNLIKTIIDNIFTKKESILLNKLASSLTLFIKTSLNTLEFQKTLFKKSVEELEANIIQIKTKEDSLNKALDKLIEEFQEEIKDLKMNELSKIKHFSIELYEAVIQDFEELSYKDIKTYLPSFLQDKFKEHIEVQEVEIKTAILQVYEKAIEKVGKIFEQLKDDLELKIDLSLIKLKNINKTSSIDIGSYALLNSGLFIMFLGGLFPLIGGLLMIASGGFLSLNSKQSEEKNLKVELKKLAHQAITNATEKVSTKTEDIIEDISKKIQVQLKELFKEEFSAIENSINQVIEEKKNTELETNKKIELIDQDINFLLSKNNELLESINN